MTLICLKIEYISFPGLSVGLWLKLHSGTNGNNILTNIEGGNEAHANGIKIDHKNILIDS